MDGGIVGADAALFFTGSEEPPQPLTTDEHIHTPKAAPSISCVMSGGSFVSKGTTPSPSEGAGFPTLALGAPFRSIPPESINHGDRDGSIDLQQPPRSAMYEFPPSFSNWGDEGSRSCYWADCYRGPVSRNESRQTIGRRFRDSREEPAVWRDGGRVGGRGHGGEMCSERQARMHALELELLERAERAQNPKRTRSMMAPSMPGMDGLVFPTSPRDPSHLLQDIRRDEVTRSISTTPGVPVRISVVPINGSKEARRGNSARQENSFSPAKRWEEQNHPPYRKESSGFTPEPPCSLAQTALGPMIPKSDESIVGNRCQHPGCTRGATFGLSGGARKSAFCTRHKHGGMVKTTSRQCAQDMCPTAPSYGLQGKRASVCSKHKKPGMVNVVTPRCQKDGCASCASYGHVGDRRPLFCVRHAHDGMLNVVSRKCRSGGCTKNPTFGHPGDIRASFCADHHRSGMSNIVSPKCRAPGCGKSPSFGNTADRKASWCKAHKQAGTVNIVYSRQLAKARLFRCGVGE